MLWFIWIIVCGLIVGAIARYLVPGEDPMNWPMTALLGIAGSVLGGFIGTFFSGFYPGWVMSVFGAIILLVVYRSWKANAG